MKQLQNKETEVRFTTEANEKDSRKATYADLLNIAMMQVTPSNTITQQRKDFRILDVLEVAVKEKPETLQFEDADFIYLTEQVKKTVWGFKHKSLIQLEDDLNEASK